MDYLSRHERWRAKEVRLEEVWIRLSSTRSTQTWNDGGLKGYELRRHGLSELKVNKE